MALPNGWVNYPDAPVQAFLNAVSPSVLSFHACTKTRSAQVAVQAAPFTETGDTLETRVLPPALTERTAKGKDAEQGSWARIIYS